MTRFDWTDEGVREKALARPDARQDPRLLAEVKAIVADVRQRGWSGLAEQAKRIDGAEPRPIPVGPAAERARRELPRDALDAMRLAARNIESFHRQTLPAPVAVETLEGLEVSKVWRPIGRAGLYVPGGKAPLFSTLLMLAIPARVAGVEELVVVTPPRRTGDLDPAIAFAAELCGVGQIWAVGGAQAIAALAYGAGSIPPVDRICGPGNAWVAAAKALVGSQPGGPGIDMPAGPSELLVIADASADPSLVAADLLSQAEHDPDAQVLLVSSSPELLAEVEAAVSRQSDALGGGHAPARFILCANLDEAVAIANLYAPEHLTLACADADQRVAEIRNAGAVFVGPQAAESFGDYLAGSSHVLPTDGAARHSSGVSTLTFLKAMSVQRVSPAAAARLSKPAAALARLEGLEAHARAAEARCPA